MAVKTEKVNFSFAFGQLKASEAPEAKARIMRKAKWSNQTFYHKKSGKRGLTEKERKVIDTIFKAYGLDEWAETQPTN